MYTNITILSIKFDQFTAEVDGLKPEFILLIEPWLTLEIPDSMILLNGCIVFLNDRLYTGGGVLIYVRHQIDGTDILAEPIGNYDDPLVEVL